MITPPGAGFKYSASDKDSIIHVAFLHSVVFTTHLHLVLPLTFVWPLEAVPKTL